jgi:hypothetical protein
LELSTSNSQCAVEPFSTTLSAANWAVGATVAVTAVDDDVADGSQVCLVRMGPTDSADGNYDGLDLADVAVTVEDDDTPGILVSASGLTISEPDGSSIVTLALTSEPTAEVSIRLSTSNGQCSVSPELVSLASVNWRLGLTATVHAVDDRSVDGSQSCTLVTAPASSLDLLYHGRNAADLVFLVQDDDRTARVYLPALLRHWPPIPAPPVLQPISNPSGLGGYLVSWSSADLAESYVLEESTDAGFSQSAAIYSGSLLSQQISGRGAARYYYRVKARNEWGDSPWSGVVWTDVTWEAEPNDSPTQANGPIVAGITYHGTFPSTVDPQDYFRVRLSSPSRLELWLTQIPDGQDYNLILRDAGLGIVGYSGELHNTSEHILTGFLPAGEYYVQVYRVPGGWSSQAYSLLFTER